MSVQYSGGLEVYKALEKMFDKLYKNSKLFKDSIDKEGCAVLKFYNDYDSESFRMYIGDEDSTLKPSSIRNLLGVFDGVCDEEYGDSVSKEEVSYISLSDVFKYEGGYSYLYEVTMDSDGGTLTISASSLPENSSGFPNIGEVLKLRPRYLEGKKSNWGTTSLPKNLSLALDKLENFMSNEAGCSYHSMLRVYMEGEELCVSLLYHYERMFKMSVFDSKALCGICEGILKGLKSFKGYVKEVYRIKNGNGTVTFRLDTDGEFILVVA